MMNISKYIRAMNRKAVCCGIKAVERASVCCGIKAVRRGITCFGLLFAFLPSFAGQETVKDEDVSGKPLMLYFRFDKSLVDSGYMDNGRTLRHLNELLTDPQICARIDSINILSFASPDGDRAYNERLAHRRSVAVKGYLVWKYPHLDQYRIHQRPQGENWQELRRLIMDDKNTPDREEVLRIIDLHKDSEQYKALLKKLNGGVPYHYIYTHLLRYLRNASICTVYVRPMKHPDSACPAALNTARLSSLLPISSSDCKSDETDKTNALSLSLLPTMSSSLSSADFKSAETGYKDFQSVKPLFALKTNLLFDAALMPNIEIEIPIGKRWSINAEYMFPWWLFDGDNYALQILMGGLEGRYWLGSRNNRSAREVLTGHFVGLYAGGGEYDLQWKENGYQGEFFIAAGISYGWAARIARNLHLEFNIGIGLLRTDYRHYHARDNNQTLLWQENGNYTWFGPTKAKISLVWLLNRKVKKGGDK